MAKYTRNAQAVLSQLVENKAGQVITKVPCKIQIPERFSERGLGQVGIDTFAYGLFPIILETGEYVLCNVCALVELNPFKTMLVTIDEVPYHEFYFDANQVVIKTTDLVKRDTLMYNVLDELIFKGKIPWYVEYEDLGKLLDTAKLHADSNVGQTQEVMEFITSMIARSKDDRSKYIRLAADKLSDVGIGKLEYIPLNSVFYAVNSTVNKLSGSYFSDGVISALVTKSDKAEKIESILRA